MRRLLLWQTNEDIGGAPPPWRVLLNEGVLAIAAGSDTTSSVMSNIFYFVLSHPEVYERLRAEVDRYYPAGEDALDPKHYAEMVYMDAVM